MHYYDNGCYTLHLRININKKLVITVTAISLFNHKKNSPIFNINLIVVSTSMINILTLFIF